MLSTERLLRGFKNNVVADLIITVVIVSQVMATVVATLAMFVRLYGAPIVVVNVWAATSFVVVRRINEK